MSLGASTLEKIGLYLKQQREELGFTLEQMSQKTKITTMQLQEIEQGNLDFFAGDITYLPFMIRRYAKALYVNFDEIKADVDSLVDKYYETKQMKVVLENKEMEKSILEKANKVSTPSKNIRPTSVAKKLEFSQLSLILVVLVIIASIIFMVVSVILPMLNQQQDPIDDDPIVSLPENPNDQDNEEPDNEQPDPVDQESKIVVSANAPNEYAISQFKEDEEVKISLAFNTQTWVRVYINDVPTDNPQSRVYQPNESIDVVTIAQDAHRVSFHVGIVRSNEFSVNDEVVLLDSEVANVTYGIRINFVFEGE